ncbi:UNVERIFIED_CONTAM: hypothetical protein Slati_1149200 [Sesamum latifolium]|uniref:Transposase n=1 Tax=Sesamum latifolium TaxID=2727402 RepID=A0AAW2XFP3_9LAMI
MGGILDTCPLGESGIVVFDYVDINTISVSYIDKLCAEIGYLGVKTYHVINNNRWKQLVQSDEIVELCLDHYCDRVVDIYLQARENIGCSQAGAGDSQLTDVEVEGVDVETLGGDFAEDETESDDYNDSDYDQTSDEERDKNDDSVYKENIDSGVEWMGNEQGNHENIDQEVGDDDSGDNDLVQSEDDFASDKGSEGEEETKFPLFNEVDAYSPKIQLGMIFASKKEFRTVIQSHAITTRRNLKITRMIKEEYMLSKYESSFRTDPKRNVKGFRNDVIRDIRVHVSKFQAFRAKHAALKAIEGKSEDQYAKLWDYAAEIRRTNPGSTVVMTLGDDNGSGARLFSKFYVCFSALKLGFQAGCRPLIGVDGCHLKGPHGGVLLAAVGIDPNNNAFSIAYAVVDKQKGLIPAFESIFPCCDNRFCVRHLHGNMKRAGFKGVAHKKLLWKAAMSTTLADFEQSMKELGTVDKNALEWLSDKSPVHWSRSHFNPYPKCDILLNNLCESFNSNILEAREKPILVMLEKIREWLMSRLQMNRDRAKEKWHGKLCPKIKRLLKKNIGLAAECIPIKADDLHFEVSCYDGSRYIVDLGQHTCSCRKWMFQVYENVIYPLMVLRCGKRLDFFLHFHPMKEEHQDTTRKLAKDNVMQQMKQDRCIILDKINFMITFYKRVLLRNLDSPKMVAMRGIMLQDLQSGSEVATQSQPNKITVRKKTQSLSTQGFRMPRRATSQPLYPPRPLVTATIGVCTRAASLHPGPGRVNIRPPVPFARGHPPVAISIMTKERAKMAAEHGFPVLKKDGKKFVTLSNLSAAVKASTSKDKKKRLDMG